MWAGINPAAANATVIPNISAILFTRCDHRLIVNTLSAGLRNASAFAYSPARLNHHSSIRRCRLERTFRDSAYS
jgi:hypothetical protein